MQRVKLIRGISTGELEYYLGAAWMVWEESGDLIETVQKRSEYSVALRQLTS